MSWRLTNCDPDCTSNKFYVVNTDLTSLIGFVLNGVKITGIPIDPDSCWIIGPDLATSTLELEAYDRIYSNCSFCVCKCCADISPPTYGCATISFAALIGTVFANDMGVQVVYTSNTSSILLTSFIGDFAGFTLEEVIDEICVNIEAGGSGFTCSIPSGENSLIVCAPSTLGEAPVNSEITIQFDSFYYLKNEAPNTGHITEATRLGYRVTVARRPVYVEANGPRPAKLYVINGDFVSNIYPSLSGNAVAIMNKDLTGVGPGPTILSHTIETGLSPCFFQAGNTFSLRRIVTGQMTLPACGGLCNPVPQPYTNVYDINCEIVSYNSGSGVLTFTVYLVQRNSTGTGLGPGNSIPANTATAACGDSGFPCGASGIFPIGTEWEFFGTGHNCGTVSVYQCDLITGQLTYLYLVELPTGGANDGCYFPDTEKVAVVSRSTTVANDLQNVAGMATIDVNTDTLADSQFISNALLSIKFNPNGGQQTAYGARSTLFCFKVDEDLQYANSPNIDQAVDVSGGISFNSSGELYTANGSLSQTVIRKGGTPAPYNNNDGAPLLSSPSSILFTCLDYTAAAPPPISVNLNGLCAGQVNLNLTIAPCLDGLGAAIPCADCGANNLIWVNGTGFVLSTVVGILTYTITGQVVSYNNCTGLLVYNVVNVSSYITSPPGIPAPVCPLTIGPQTWIWTFYPNFKGTIDIHFHESSGRLFLGRTTSAGGIVQAYQVVPYVDPATTFASRVNYYPPGYPFNVLSGSLNFQEGTGKFFMTTIDGSKIYVFDPGTNQWDPVVIKKPGMEVPQTPGTDGFINLSYTGDYTNPDNINLYSSTNLGTELGVISYFLGPTSRLQGKFIGEITCHPCPPIDTPSIYQRSISDPVKRFFKIDESLCDINATKRFANGYWSKIKQSKFGVTDCCNTDLDILWLNKQASDISQMSVSGVTCIQDPAVPRQGCCPWLPLQSCDLIPDPFGGTSIIGFAGETIAYGKLLMLSSNGRFYLNQPSDISTYQRCIGFATQNAVNNQQERVLITGQIINIGWSLVTGAIYYASPDGNITSTVPSSGISQVVGYALGPATFMVDIKQPIIL